MLEAATHFGWEIAASNIRGPTGFSHLLQKLNEAIDVTSSTPLRVRTLLNHEGVIVVETNSTPAVTEWNLFPKRLPPPKTATPEMNVSSLTGGALTVGEGDSVYGDAPTDIAWDVYIDTHLTPASGFTSFKTTNRDMYSNARERVGIQNMAEKKEVLIVGEGEEIMEGSLTTVFFWREGKWVTPPVASGGQIGTTRRWALERGLVVEGVVKKGELLDGEECWISNGVRGFQWGKVRLV
jgi:4-amino-4-deoxychorismate lyase